MHEYMLDISDKSIWYTATPTAAVCSFPFYITEAGHFFANHGYFTARSDYDSLMLLYTLGGRGKMEIDGASFFLDAGSAVIVDCRVLHTYGTADDTWDFLWIHIKGSSAEPLFKTLYQNTVHPISVSGTGDFSDTVKRAVKNTQSGGIIAASEISADIHSIFNTLIRCDLSAVKQNQKGNHADDIERAVSFIKDHYSAEITIDDIVDNIHISKYHFIRLFKRVIGVTPYAYLMSFRINRSKLLLRTSDKTINDIALECGFADTSNFITQFKKHTGQKPTGYRAAFR